MARTLIKGYDRRFKLRLPTLNVRAKTKSKSKTRTISTALLLALLSVPVLATRDTSAFSGSGEGTLLNPYRVLNCAQLQEIQDDLDAHYALYANINCSVTTEWNEGAGFLPIGDCWSVGFTGSLDGRGHVVSDLFINRPNTDRQSLFGCTADGGTISNIGMQNVDITAQRYAGGIAGVLVGSTSSITNSYVTGEIKLVQGEVMGSGQFAGGIASGLEGGSQIINSYSATDITTSYQDAWGEGGIAGYAYGGSTVTNSFWDTETPSTVLITEGGGTGKTTLQMKTQSTFTDAGWDFTDIWEMDENLNNGYASLRTEGVDAQPLCEETIVTASAARVACDLQYSAPVTAEDTGTTTWAARYRKSGDTQWTYVDIKNPATGFMNFTGLDPETNYDLSLRASNNLFDDWLTIDGTTLAADSDVDADGTLDTQEDASPNDGDINGDGVLDSLQANMTSFLSPVSGQYVALETNCEDNYNLQIGMESDAQPDSGYNYPTGLLSFVARGCDVGSTQTFNIYFFGEYSDQLTVRKSRGASYLAVPGATVTGVTIGGSTASKASYQVQDGGELDDDGVADGNIVDPVGLASSVQVQLASTGRNSSLVATVALMSIALAALMAKLNPRKV